MTSLLQIQKPTDLPPYSCPSHSSQHSYFSYLGERRQARPSMHLHSHLVSRAVWSQQDTLCLPSILCGSSELNTDLHQGDSPEDEQATGPKDSTAGPQGPAWTSIRPSLTTSSGASHTLFRHVPLQPMKALAQCCRSPGCRDRGFHTLLTVSAHHTLPLYTIEPRTAFWILTNAAGSQDGLQWTFNTPLHQAQHVPLGATEEMKGQT